MNNLNVYLWESMLASTVLLVGNRCSLPVDNHLTLSYNTGLQILNMELYIGTCEANNQADN